LILLGRSGEAIEQLEKAKQVNPQHPEWFQAYLGWAYYHSGQFERAVKTLNLMNAPPAVFRIFLAASYAQLDRTEEARNEAAQVLQLEPGFNLKKLKFLPYKNESDRDKLEVGLRKAGLPE
jgi:Flp pilus assembly protein TadD